MYDRNNDDSATVWLLASIDASLRKEVTDRVSKSDGFVAHWLQLIACIQSVSFARFDKIKREIEDLSILKIPQQNVKTLATSFLLKAKELCAHGHYEHRLTLTMLNKFLEGGGTSGDHYTMQYCYALLDVRKELDKTLVDIGSLSNLEQDKRIARANLTYKDICKVAEDE